MEKKHTPEPAIAEGLIEYLQAMGGNWSMKLTMERLAFAQIIGRYETELATYRNTLAGIEDPAAFMWAAEEMVEWLESVENDAGQIPDHHWKPLQRILSTIKSLQGKP